MKILDANMILRYLINDNEAMAKQTESIITNSVVLILPEVIAEVVYVLSGVYHQERTAISSGLQQFLKIKNVTTNCGNTISTALCLYMENRLDFVNCLLCAYHMEYQHEICTFDKKLNRLIHHTSIT